MNKKEILLFALLAAASFYLRLNYISDMEYKGEERLVYESGARIATLKEFPLTSETCSIGIPNPPLFNYMIALYAFIGKTPVGATVCIASLNALAVLAFYLFIRKRFSPFIAWSSSFLLATTPWAVIYSRKIWCPDPIAAFSIFMMISAQKVFDEKKPVFWIPLSISAIILLQLHYSSLFLVFAIPLVMAINRFRPTARDIKYMVICLIVCIFSFLPLLVYCLKNMGPLAAEFGNRGYLSLPLHLRIFESAKGIMQITTGLAMRRTLGNDIALFNSFLGGTFIVVISQILYTLSIIFFIIGIAYALKKIKENFILRYSIIILFSAIFYMTFISTRTGGYFFFITYPIPFIFIALGMECLNRKRIQTYLMTSLILMNIYITLSFENFIHINGGSTGDYGVAYRCQKFR